MARKKSFNDIANLYMGVKAKGAVAG
jgi:hypothetical protein